ncbi:cyclophilin-RNA interacting protein, partial [Reticulomyxa filosa]
QKKTEHIGTVSSIVKTNSYPKLGSIMSTRRTSPSVKPSDKEKHLVDVDTADDRDDPNDIGLASRASGSGALSPVLGSPATTSTTPHQIESVRDKPNNYDISKQKEKEKEKERLYDYDFETEKERERESDNEKEKEKEKEREKEKEKGQEITPVTSHEPEPVLSIKAQDKNDKAGISPEEEPICGLSLVELSSKKKKSHQKKKDDASDSESPEAPPQQGPNSIISR